MLNIEVYNDNDDDLEIFGVLHIQNRVNRRIYVRAAYFEIYNNNDFFKRFRLTKPSTHELLELIENDLEFVNDRNYSVSPINQLLIFLRVLATGNHLLSIADFSGVHFSTVSRIIVRVGRAISSLINRYIKMPQTQDEIKQTQNAFFEVANFPRVISVIDGTHIRIQSPGGEDAEIFRNRKSYFSINVQVAANSNYVIQNIAARWPGSSHDNTIFNNSRLRLDFENNMYPNCVMLGDSGYAVRPYLLTPILNPVTRPQQLYNESHIRTRVRIENVFGIWKRRFPILAYGCRLKVQTVLLVIVASAILHNIARKNNEDEPPADNDVDQHELQILINNGQIPEVHEQQHRGRGVGFMVRDNFVNNYFGTL